MSQIDHTDRDQNADLRLVSRDSRDLQRRRMDQFERGEIDGYLVRRVGRHVFVDAIPKIITDKAA